ncbi:MAG TPA: hypothetical protein PLU95_06140, partial [Syntrophales bacterium]|nr:hypothetical protein [Syntrophales bacterium]
VPNLHPPSRHPACRWACFIYATQEFRASTNPQAQDEVFNVDDIVKSPYAALRFILRHCDVRTSTPHSSGFARLASGAFYFVVSMMTFCEFINIHDSHRGASHMSSSDCENIPSIIVLDKRS